MRSDLLLVEEGLDASDGNSSLQNPDSEVWNLVERSSYTVMGRVSGRITLVDSAHSQREVAEGGEGDGDGKILTLKLDVAGEGHQSCRLSS